MSEVIQLDPPGVAGTRAPFQLTPFIGEPGPSWGDAAITAQMADQIVGSSPVDYVIPNRTVTIPLNIMDADGNDFEDVRAALQAAVGLWQDQGGWLSRTINGHTLYLDVVGAKLTMGGSSSQALWQLDTDAKLELETLPDWYGEEIGLDPIVGGGLSGEVVSVLKQGGLTAHVAGNFPRGNRCRMDVSDTSGNRQTCLIAAFRRRHYDSAATAALSYEAETLTPLDIAATSVRSGASGAGNNVMRHGKLGTRWTPVVGTNIATGNKYLTHAGSYRVFARVYSLDGSNVKLRFSWDVNDLINPTTNDSYTIPDDSQFYIADLGDIRLNRVPVGTHRWAGQIEAIGAFGVETVEIDKLWFVPIDEYMGKYTAPFDVGEGLIAFLGRDDFATGVGGINGRALTPSGSWGIAGDTTDGSVLGGFFERAATIDTDYFFALAGAATPSDVVVQATFSVEAALTTNSGGGLFARYTNVSNWFGVKLLTKTGMGNLTDFDVVKKQAGVETIIGQYFMPSAIVFDANYAMRLVALANGQWFLYVGFSPAGQQALAMQSLQLVASGWDAFLTSLTGASGRVGLLDFNFTGTAQSRFYLDFGAWVPPLDAIMYANRAAELRTDGALRQDTTGTSYGPITTSLGNLPRLPCSGDEGVPVEVFAKWSRGDFDKSPDSDLDTGRVQMYYRPCYLFTPEQFPGS